MTHPTYHPAPWPVVNECHWPALTLVKQQHTCSQCDGSHDHQWVGWHDVDSKVTRFADGAAVPVRCRICGGRKCDMPTCFLRRHHRGDHEEF